MYCDLQQRQVQPEGPQAKQIDLSLCGEWPLRVRVAVVGWNEEFAASFGFVLCLCNRSHKILRKHSVEHHGDVAVSNHGASLTITVTNYEGRVFNVLDMIKTFI
jgi:hypothetical protein